MGVMLHNNNTGADRSMRVHMLVAMTFMGHIPDGTHKIVVDHDDNIKWNNALYNLRLLTHRENASKDMQKGKSTSQYTGVFWDSHRHRYCSKIWVNGKTFYVGSFLDEKAASDAYQHALSVHNSGGDVFAMRPKKTKISQYIGVTKKLTDKRWTAKRRIKNKDYHIGVFDTELEAHNAYLNFKPKTQND